MTRIMVAAWPVHEDYCGNKVDTRSAPSIEPVRHMLQSPVSDQSTVVIGVLCPGSSKLHFNKSASS